MNRVFLVGVAFCFWAMQLWVSNELSAQITFSKSISLEEEEIELHDAVPSSDLGYVFSGSLIGEASQMLVGKLNCSGEMVWSKTLGTTDAQNYSHSVVREGNDNNLYILHNTGSFADNSMNIVVLKMSLSGNLVWQKEFGDAGNDIGRDLEISSDGGLLITGSTSSFGSDQGSFEFSDLLLFKLDNDGNLQWSKSFGVAESSQDAYAVSESGANNELTIVGSDEIQDSRQCLILHSDANGNQIWSRVYGDTLHNNLAFDVLHQPNGNPIVCGSTTFGELDLNSTSNAFIMNVSSGSYNVNWTSVIEHGDSQNDIAQNLTTYGNGEYLMSVESNSFSEVFSGTETGKSLLFKFDNSGTFNWANAYTTGDSRNTGIINAEDESFLYFSTSASYSDPCCSDEGLLLRLDPDLNSGCNENDLSGLYNSNTASWTITTPAYIEGTGILSQDWVATEAIVEPVINTQCENYPPFLAEFDVEDVCLGDEITLTAQTTGEITEYEWDMDNGDFFDSESITYTYEQPGTFEVTLTVNDGCQVAQVSYELTIFTAPNVAVGPDLTILEGQSVVLGGDPTGDEDWQYIWNNINSIDNPISANPEAAPTVTTEYTVTAIDQGGCIGTATQTVFVIEVEDPPVDPIEEGELFVPNIFSPNGDELNDKLFVYGGPYPQFKFEVFNRVGQKVFVSEDQSEGWDGTFNGELAPSGVYYYQFFGKNRENKPFSTAGNVTLIR